eukprot:TRINITY_DN1864_c0_g1_i2.p1 TRINITY_DN1864_c0_g1~~TRINITY_DN1864_c0_g1_i2.p1  ORF type:complete len:197 (-),score=70.30 TRINITY_DN1864_c0_g1_i2:165-755(-)
MKAMALMRTLAPLAMCSVQGFVLHSMAPRAATASLATLQMSRGIYDTISEQMKTAMKAKEADKLAALRNIRAAFLKETKEAGAGDTLPDDKCMAVLRKLSKMRKESIDMYAKGGRQELVDKETVELGIIESFLPQLADKETTTQWAQEAIESAGAKGPSDMGKVMGKLMSQHKDEMDGKIAQQVVGELLKAKAASA